MMNTNKRKSPMKPFSIDYAAKTIVLTKPFAQRASVPGSTEYRQMAALHRD